jgi:hypothetical protein
MILKFPKTTHPKHPIMETALCLCLVLGSQIVFGDKTTDSPTEYGLGSASQCTVFHEQQIKFAPMLDTIQDVGWQVIGESADSDDLGISGNMDIRRAWIEQSGLQLRLSIETRLPIRTEYPSATDTGVFLWLIDADQDPATGQSHIGIGSEFNIRAVIGEQLGGGFVDVTGALPGGGSGSVSVNGDVVQIVISLNQVSSPEQVSWSASSFEVIDNLYIQGNSESEVAVATVLPAPPRVSRVELRPPLLMLSPSGPSQGQLVASFWDAEGNKLSEDGHLVSYFEQPASELVNLDIQTGSVEVISPPVNFWDTPNILAIVDELQSSNQSTMRITDSDLGFEHQYYSGETVSFYLPPTIEEIDLDSITAVHDIVLATDYSYWAQQYGVGTTPWDGNTQYFVLDIGEDNTVPCGLSGNPVRLGWTLGPGGQLGGSCYVDTPSQHPQWFVIFHELAHNFTLWTSSFMQFADGYSPQRSTYVEGLASVGALWTLWAVDSCPTNLNSQALSDLDIEWSNLRSHFLSALQNYQNDGANYSQINPDIIDGIALELFDSYGPAVWFDLFSLFLPVNEPLPCPVDTEAEQATLFAATFSASVGEDLRSLFSVSYGYPINDTVWPELFNCARNRINARSFSAQAACDFFQGTPCRYDKDCSDNNACTINSCHAGFCRLPEPVSCDDGIACTLDNCDAPLGCKNEPRSNLCNDTLPCTGDVCDEVFGCVHQNLPDETSCEDGDSCTIGASCLLGECIAAENVCIFKDGFELIP